jgi:hypothetical protein
MKMLGAFLLFGMSFLVADSTSQTIPASNPLFVNSVLGESWDTSHAATSGYIDCMMPLSDVDLTVSLRQPGPVRLNFDTKVYPPGQPAGEGPIWISEVDGAAYPERVTMGPNVGSISTPSLAAGKHRVRFVQVGNISGSLRWAPKDPQLSRVTGVTIPQNATLEKTQRAAEWFLPIADSIGEGAVNMNTTTATWRSPSGAYTDANRAWPAVTARFMNLSIAGTLISGIGVVHPGTGVPVGVIDAGDAAGSSDLWSHILEGVPRPFKTSPKFIMLSVGSNEWATDVNVAGHADKTDPNSADAGFQANLETFIARVRSKPQLRETPILLSVSFGGFKRTPLQKAVQAYRAAHPNEANLYVFDLAFGSPALTTTEGIDEVKLFNGLTKNRPDDADTVPSPQASDRSHPYAIATPAIGSVDAHKQIGTVMAARLTDFLNHGIVPATGALNAGDCSISSGEPSMIRAKRATGGSAPYTYQFQSSKDGDKDWSNLAKPIDNQASTIHPIEVEVSYAAEKYYRVIVTDSAEPPATVSSVCVKMP